MTKIYDIGIIGGGPAGYTAAIRAAQLGMTVVLFEKEFLGGTCLNKGCIPTKTILHCAEFYKNLKKAEKFGVFVEHASYNYEKIFLRKSNVVEKLRSNLKKLLDANSIEIIQEYAKIKNNNIISANNIEYLCKNIIIATGSIPFSIKGLECDGEYILNSDQILNLKEIPENILIIGSGAIGIEWARIFSALNKNVTIIEKAKNILPIADIDVSKRLGMILKKSKINFYTDTIVEKISRPDVILNNGKIVQPDIILSAAGRMPCLPESDIPIDIEKCIKTDENCCTNTENIYAIGDVNGKIQLAHAAIHQAICTIDKIAGNGTEYCNKEKVPSVIYGMPEIAWVGKTEQMLEGLEYKTSMFPIAALGKAQADDEIDGFVKVISQNGKIIGAHIISPEAASIIQQFAIMIDNNIDIKEVTKTVFAHPTYSESVFESVLGLNNMSLHTFKVKQ